MIEPTRNSTTGTILQPTIFLDIDGVLVTWRHNPNRGGIKLEFDPVCQKLLEDFLTKHPDCQIILSSTWRNSGRRLTRIREQSVIISDVIAGTTEVGVSYPRHIEISDYLEYNPLQNYVIVDDETMPKKFAPRTVQTHNTYGLQPYHVQQMEEILYGKTTV